MATSPSLPRRLLDRIKRDWNRAAFERVSAGVTQCAPLARGSQPFTVLSMVQPRDTLSYLLALRSFALQTQPARVVVVCDPAMQASDIAVLRQGVPHIEIRRAEEFRHPAMPVGGTWERLAAIATYAREGYVIQLDADTLSLASLPEVSGCIAAGRAFVLGETEAQQLTTRQAAHDVAATEYVPDSHIQCAAEYMMVKAALRGPAYVRGCSGFSGFPKSEHLHEMLVEFSTQMRGLLGSRWTEWGTEQVASNYLAANQPDCVVLPFPVYGTPDCLDRPGRPQPRFVHFIGSMRYTTSKYADTAVHCLEAMKAAGPQRVDA